MNNGAHKAGSPEAWQTVHDSPGLQDLWQLHTAEDSDASHNSPVELIAIPLERRRTVPTSRLPPQPTATLPLPTPAPTRPRRIRIDRAVAALTPSAPRGAVRSALLEKRPSLHSPFPDSADSCRQPLRAYNRMRNGFRGRSGLEGDTCTIAPEVFCRTGSRRLAGKPATGCPRRFWNQAP